jgi:hypothetical protein
MKTSYFHSSEGSEAIGGNRQAAIKAGVPAISPTGNQNPQSRPLRLATTAATRPIAQCNSPALMTIGQNGKFDRKFGTGGTQLFNHNLPMVS